MTLKEVKDFLSKIQPFQELDDATLGNIAGGVIIEFYPKGTIITREENFPCEYLQIIKKGQVSVSLRKDKQTTEEIRGKGDSFGCLRDKSGSIMHITAIEDTACYLVSKEVLHKILEIHPSISGLFDFKTTKKLKMKGGK